MSRSAYNSYASGRLVTALGGRELAHQQRCQIAAMDEAADRMVTVCAWLEKALRSNGIGDEKLILSRQGIGREFASGLVDRSTAGSSNTLRIGFVGRCDPIKGLAVLLDAIRLVPRDSSLELVIHAMANTEEERRYRDTLIARAADDLRIKFFPTLSQKDLPALLAGFDLLAVPSQVQETGPLVVLEAQAVGVPVLGSDLGGIAELVTPGVDGHLVTFSDSSAWADAICDAVAGTLPCLRRPRAPRPVRSMADVASEMAALYGSLT